MLQEMKIISFAVTMTICPEVDASKCMVHVLIVAMTHKVSAELLEKCPPTPFQSEFSEI